MTASLHVGLGTIGRQVLAAAVASGKARPLGGVDPLYAGAGLSALVNGADGPILSSLAESVGIDARVALVSTASTVEAVAPDLIWLLERGINVVSTCEELAYPWLRTPDLAADIDACARANGVTVVGTGINPGFVLDALPVFLARPSLGVRTVTARRYVNTSRRRQQLQAKTGSGLTVAEFKARAEAGTIGHVGLPESAVLIARGMGWTPDLDAMTVVIDPVVATAAISSDHFSVQPGRVCGQEQKLHLPCQGGATVAIELRMSLGETEEYDEVVMDGEPPVHTRLLGGIFGDTATANCTVNIIPQVIQARPGLVTVLDMPPA